jgi:ribonuclease HI
MKIVAWNCRGLQSSRAVRALREVRGRLNPDVFFLSETHLDNAKADNLRRKVGFDHMAVHESDGRSGGLLLLWKSKVRIRVEEVSKYYIDAVVDEDGGWRFTGLYGEPEWHRKALTWEAIRSIKGDPTNPWLIMGDFNEIMYNSEKEGGRPRTQRQLQSFHDVLSECGLNDMGFVGDLYTWRRGQIRERLDRAVANMQWAQLYPQSMLVNSESIRSDHRPIMMDTKYLDPPDRSAKKRFEARWLQEDTVEEMIKAAWARAKARGEGPSFSEKVNEVHEELHSWDREVLKAPTRRISDLKKELERLKRGPMTEANTEAQKEIMVRLELMLEQEEIHWFQRARANWLRQGDRNTSFFHNFATKRRKKNTIKSLIDENGQRQEKELAMRNIVQNYFENLFTSEVGEPDPSVLADVNRAVTQDMNMGLMAPFTAEEVKKALFQIGDYKAPGPDGMHAVFFKRFWGLVGDDLVKEVLAAVNSAHIPDGWNDTTIVLIPKINDPTLVSQFRPISLCNVVYKVISKMLANRIRGILPDVISDHQSAFVPGRLITDNILLAYECIHRIKKKQGKKGLCAVKLDMHKAYDRVEWSFLEKIMWKMGFDRRWVTLIMACVKSVKYKVRVNSSETDTFIPTRGLRQGDPLSPYLFLFVAQGLSSMLKGAENRGELQGVHVCRDAPPVSHLLFADDSLILMQADKSNAETLKNLLDRYCSNSGQMISDAKSSIFFSPNTEVETKVEVCETLNIMTESLTDKYLGLPALVGADRSDCFQYLVDRVRGKTKGWKEKLLSMGGKEVLIKSVAQAVPVFAMMVFRIPKNICKGITDAISQFWWGDDDDHKRIHWKAWWKLCIPKSKGGMGFRDLEAFNKALLAKQVWRLLLEPESLCARVLRAKYYPDGKLLDAKLKSGSSFTWQSVFAGLECFKKGCIWRVGDGSQIKIWEDNWIPSSHNMKIQTPRGNNLITRVEELINPITGVWDVQLIRSIFWEVDANRILQIPLRHGREDVVAWHFTKNSLFSVGSAYHLQWLYKFGENRINEQASGVGDDKVWSQLWKLEVPAKIKIFGWRVLHGLLPCKGVLANRHIDNSSSCPACHSNCEDIKHVLFGCSQAKEIWRILGIEDKINTALAIHHSGSVVVAEMITRPKQIDELNHIGFAELILTGSWYIWWQRRQYVHGEPVQNPTRAALSIATLTTNFQRSMKKVKNNTKKEQGWKRPPEGELLLNVDASYSPERGSGGTGAIIRDSTGSFVGARVSFYEFMSDAATAEVTALREGLVLAQTMGCNRIRIQSDCLKVVETMRQGGFTATISGPVYEQCDMMWHDFVFISLEHCNREANCVAHELARVASQEKMTCNWVTEPPSFILGALVNDVTVLHNQ